MPWLNKLLLAAIFVALSCSTILWNIEDRTPPPWDPADHTSAAYDYYHSLSHGDFAGFSKDFFFSAHYYAPLVHLVTAGFFLIFGASRVSAIFVNLLSLGVLLLSVEWLWRRLYSARGSPADGSAPQPPAWGAAVAALLASCYHFSGWLLHDAFLDYPLMAIVTLTIALLVRAGDFSVRRHALAVGVAIGLGALTKQTYVFFVWLPLLYAAAGVLFKGSGRARTNFVLAMLTGIAIAAVWYFPHAEDVIAIYRVNRQAAVNENEAPVFSFLSLVNYLFGLVSPQMQVPFGVLFILSLAYTIIRRRRESTILYLWLFGGIAMFTLIANKDMRYTVPVLPAAALISTSWLSDPRLFTLGRKFKWVMVLRWAAVSAIVVWALVNFYVAQWPKSGLGYYVDTPRFRWTIFAGNDYGFDHRPLGDDWGVPAIVRKVAELGPVSAAGASAVATPTPIESVSPRTSNPGNEQVRPLLGVVVNLPHLNPSTIALYARLMSEKRGGPPVILVDWLVTDSSIARLRDCDYILVRTGLDRVGWVAPVEREMELLLSANQATLEKVASFPMPRDGIESVLYRVNRLDSNQANPSR